MFLLIFGAGMEEQDDENDMYRVFVLSGGTVGIFQTSLLFPLLFRHVSKFYFVTILMEPNITGLCYVISGTGLAYLYHYILLLEYIQDETVSDIISHLFDSLVVFSSIYCFLELCITVVKMYIYTNLSNAWNKIKRYQQIVGLLQQAEQKNIRRLIEDWKQLRDDDVSHMFDQEVDNMMSKELTPEEAQIFNSYKYTPEIETLSHLTIKRFLYDLHFQKKRFVNYLITNEILFKTAKLYAYTFLIPAGFIAVTRIFGYQNAFGEGVDLFKTYMLLTGFLINNMKSKIDTLTGMLVHRPFNIGDMLLVEDDIYRVKDLSMSKIWLQGSTCLFMPADSLLSNNIVNMSGKDMTESLDFHIPNTLEEDARFFLREIFLAYHKTYPYDIIYDEKNQDLRIGYFSNDSSSKIMKCHWKYQFALLDRSHYKKISTRIRNFLIENYQHKISKTVLYKAMIEGGGLNNQVETFNF